MLLRKGDSCEHIHETILKELGDERTAMHCERWRFRGAGPVLLGQESGREFRFLPLVLER